MDDSFEDTQPTQKALDPRRLGKHRSGFSDQDISDIICLLIPYSRSAREEVERLSQTDCAHTIGRDDAERVELNCELQDDAQRFEPLTCGMGEHAIVLRFSAKVKNPVLGFTLGRNRTRCDIFISDDPLRRLSNVHFRIFLNDYGVLMLEDQSTNGTVVDEKLLKSKSAHPNDTKRTLNSGSSVKILMHQLDKDLEFMVRVPRREGDDEAQYRKNLVAYMRRQHAVLNDVEATFIPGPGGHVDLFPQSRPGPPEPVDSVNKEATPNTFVSQRRLQRFPKPWNGSDKYNRVGDLGKGAFATVYKVTSKFDGRPYAAKELDKRKFMKNGVVDGKVHNEMEIMRQVQHGNIVRYVDHLEWDGRLLIIIMEYVAGGDLGRLIVERAHLSEHGTRVMAVQLLDALRYLHKLNITHRDVKPDNILISSEDPFVVKLTDFGLSKVVDDEQTFLKTFCGTLLYCAPEVYSEFAEYDERGNRHPRKRRSRQPAGQRYGHAVDIWSLGGVLFFALTGLPPYPAKSGISYSELLHQIMTQDLNLAPLREAGVSSVGIDFLSRMLDRRPESRATVDELLKHPWLEGHANLTPDKFSQLSIQDDEDKENQQSSLQDLLAEQSDDEIVDEEDGREGGLDKLANERSLVNGGPRYESEKENQTVRPRRRPPRLFGEANVPAAESSGGIPSKRLDLPTAADGMAETEILWNSQQSIVPESPPDEEWSSQHSSEIRDSFDFDSSESATPKPQTHHQARTGGNFLASAVSSMQSRSLDDLYKRTFDVASQSLGGTETILENLNMKSRGSLLFPRDADLASSKRKPNHDRSDEFDKAAAPGRSAVKRLRSECVSASFAKASMEAPAAAPAADLIDEDEYELYVQIPSIDRRQSGRQIDTPVHKAAYWSVDDRSSWHLRYPEMTQLQLDAFQTAADTRGERFAPGSRLWSLASKYFPPVHHEESLRSKQAEDCLNLDEQDLLSTAETAGMPDTQLSVPNLIVPVRADLSGKRIVASFVSDAESLVPSITVFATESMLSWGRAPQNTREFFPKTEMKVPKYGFRILLWKERFDSAREPRPWIHGSSVDAKSFHFYISTKASRGIFVNGEHLHSHDHKKPNSPSKYWMRLHAGDVVDVWALSHDSQANRTRLNFACTWGGSSIPRPANASPPFHVSDSLARRLDEAYARAERRMPELQEHDRKMEEATTDAMQRQLVVDRERDRSRLFELRKQEVVRAGAQRATASRRSPASELALANRASPSSIVSGMRRPRHATG